MAVIYYKRVRAGKMDIEDVPDMWRAQVEEMLMKEGE